MTDAHLATKESAASVIRALQARIDRINVAIRCGSYTTAVQESSEYETFEQSDEPAPAANGRVRYWLDDYAAMCERLAEKGLARDAAMLGMTASRAREVRAYLAQPDEPRGDPPGKWSDGGKKWTGSTILERVYPETLAVIHIFYGEEVVTGGVDGQVHIATFASEKAAQAFVDLARKHLTNVTGERRAPTKAETLREGIDRIRKEIDFPENGGGKNA